MAKPHHYQPQSSLRLRDTLHHHLSLIAASFVFAVSVVLACLAATIPHHTYAKAVVGFNPGNIINDYTMGNYSTMSVADIQAFLTKKNPCNNTNYNLYLEQTKAYPNISWHWSGTPQNGHFVCISEETFGDGVELGVKGGQTAAQIIYNAAREYKINPQVLLVLLEKEQGLISDTFPHSRQYRSATGYGCPDTAACDAKYYGFKNQVFRAAELFRYTLDNGSVLYPDHQNGVWVGYNPSRSCGGTYVYIENRATSALYRYTPYQPNAAALAAGYGQGDSCSAYGNRNFYQLFNDWFGSTQTSPFEKMSSARILQVKSGASLTHHLTLTKTTLPSGYRYFTYKTYIDDELCLADDDDKAAGQCIRYSDLNDYPTVVSGAMSIPRYMAILSSSKSINIKTQQISATATHGLKYFSRRLNLGDQLCLLEPTGDTCYFYDTLAEISPTSAVSAMDIPRTLYLNSDAKKVTTTNGYVSDLNTSELVFSTKIYLNQELCLGTDTSLRSSSGWCVPYSELQEYPSAPVARMDIPRVLYVPTQLQYRHATTGIPGTTTRESAILFAGRSTIDGKLCLIPKTDYDAGRYNCYPYYEGLKEVNSFSKMTNARNLKVLASGKYTSAFWLAENTSVAAGKHYFTQKTYINGELCLANDAEAAAGKCVLYSQLSEL